MAKKVPFWPGQTIAAATETRIFTPRGLPQMDMLSGKKRRKKYALRLMFSVPLKLSGMVLEDQLLPGQIRREAATTFMPNAWTKKGALSGPQMASPSIN